VALAVLGLLGFLGLLGLWDSVVTCVPFLSIGSRHAGEALRPGLTPQPCLTTVSLLTRRTAKTGLSRWSWESCWPLTTLSSARATHPGLESQPGTD
jgi:hypothetical protein